MTKNKTKRRVCCVCAWVQQIVTNSYLLICHSFHVNIHFNKILVQHKKFDNTFVKKGLLFVLIEDEQTLNRNSLLHLGAHNIAGSIRIPVTEGEYLRDIFSERHSQPGIRQARSRRTIKSLFYACWPCHLLPISMTSRSNYQASIPSAFRPDFYSISQMLPKAQEITAFCYLI